MIKTETWKPKPIFQKKQRKPLKEIQHVNNNTKVYPFDKGSKLVVLSEGDAIKKIGEQIRKTKFIDEDLTQE